MRREQEKTRIRRILAFDMNYRSPGRGHIAGVDEAGRGPIAGPVVAAAVIFPRDVDIPGIDDSKRLSPARRFELSALIRRKALAIGVGMADEREIDDINILQATFRAMQRAIDALNVRPDHVLVDGHLRNPYYDGEQSAIIAGDRLSFSIAAASIIAKVARDTMMIHYESIYPPYGFARHKGYPTPQHIDAIRANGFCPIHRRSFTIRALESQDG